LPADRLAVGQLLVRLLHEFRTELSAPAADHGYADLRPPHLHIFGNVGLDGVRLIPAARGDDAPGRLQDQLAGDRKDIS
jgi:hypothetical protein